MSILTESPFPNKIKTLYVPRPNFATGEVVWGFWLMAGGCPFHYADWAMPTEQMVELARANWAADRRMGAYQYYMPYADSMALRPVEEA
ncbi:MAG: hypothetical protein KIT52_06840 [Anaerolineae bacterium]|nr:hypothetical protein [Anaerolineae bacterium]